MAFFIAPTRDILAIVVSNERTVLPTSSACGILHRSVTPVKKRSPEKMLYQPAALGALAVIAPAGQMKKSGYEWI